MANEADRNSEILAAGAALLADPMTDVSRKRQTALLVLCLTTILISTGVVTVKTGSLSGFTLQISEGAVGTLLYSLLAVACAYLGGTYYFCVAQDRARFTYLTGTYLRVLTDRLGGVNEAQNVLAERRREAFNRVQQAVEAQRELLNIDERYAAPLHELSERYHSSVERFLAVHDDDAKDDPAPRIALMNDIQNEQAEIDQAEAQLLDQRARERAPHEERLLLLAHVSDRDDMLKQHADTAAEVDALAMCLRDVTRLRRWRSLLDVIVPGVFLTLAITAAGWAVFR